MRSFYPNANAPTRCWTIVAVAACALVPFAIGCANGVTSSEGNAGNGGETSSSSPTGGGTSTTSSASEGGGGSGGEAGMGGGGGTTSSSTTSTTTSTSSSTSTSTATDIVCDPPAMALGHTPEMEPNNSKALGSELAGTDVGFVASLCPPGDLDVFAIPVTVAGASLRVKVTGPGGQCPAGSKLYLRLFDGNGSVIGEEASPLNGSCPVIDPVSTPEVQSLAIGTYYAQVENINFGVLSTYLLEVESKEPSCGDEILHDAAGEQCDDGNNTNGDGCTSNCLIEVVCGDSITHTIGGEQCDDGNTQGGDGCSPTCQYEANYVLEVEPNEQNTPTSLVGFEGAVGSILPIADQDWYSFDVTVPGSSVTIATSNGQNGCGTTDTKINLYKANSNTPIAEDDDDGITPCSLIKPSNDPSASNMAVGTYLIKVEEYSNDAAIGSYVLTVDLSAPGCGDGLVQIGEQCDDDNTTPGDGCSATCLLEGNFTTESEPNPLATPDSLNGFDGIIASMSPAGDADVFSFDVAVPNSKVTLEVTDGASGCPSFDSFMSLYGPNNMLVATDDDDGADLCPKLDPFLDIPLGNLAVGTYKVEIAALSMATVIPQYVLKVKVLPPGCGDGFITGAEQCDDSNTVSGDGCSALCVSEAPWEIEPNNIQGQAGTLWPGFNHWIGSIQSPGDQDWYKIVVQAGQSVTLDVHSVGNAAACPYDITMMLVDGGGTMVASSDDDGVVPCPRLSPMVNPVMATLPAGPYYVQVQRLSATSTGGPYQLDFTAQ